MINIYPITPVPAPHKYGSGTTIPDDILIKKYLELRSVWKVGDAVGLSGQSVHRRLTKLGLMSNNYIKDDEKKKIMDVYLSGVICGDGKLNALSEELGRSRQNICRWVRQHGLTVSGRKKSQYIIDGMARRAREYIKNNGHQRGFAGKKHSQSTKDRISITSKEMWEKMTPNQKRATTVKQMLAKISKYGQIGPKNVRGTWKAGWREIRGNRYFFRSRWEANYARYLDFLTNRGDIEKWEFEPETFWFNEIKRGSVTYLPDFRVTEKTKVYYVEVKGWMDKRSKTKIKRMKKYYPDIELRLVEAKQYKELEKKISPLILGWEYS